MKTITTLKISVVKGEPIGSSHPSFPEPDPDLEIWWEGGGEGGGHPDTEIREAGGGAVIQILR